MRLVIIGVMLAICAALVLIAAARGQDTVVAGFRNAGRGLGQLLPLLVVGLFVMGFVEALVPPELVERWLSEGSGWRGLCLAWIAGALTPGGSLMGLPMAAGMLRAGAGLSVVVTYLTSLATLSVMRLPLELSILGGRLAAARIIASLLLPLFAGAMAKLIGSWFGLTGGSA